MPETDLTLFSTQNLHIFQTYYGGLRQSADKTEWVYSDLRMARQIVEKGQELKPWLSAMGVSFLERQIIIVGALWFRGNKMLGADIDTYGVDFAEQIEIDDFRLRGEGELVATFTDKDGFEEEYELEYMTFDRHVLVWVVG